ncbi:hypothetical protein BJX96DRAFT_142894 [Aspergillus floccosus]
MRCMARSLINPIGFFITVIPIFLPPYLPPISLPSGRLCRFRVCHRLLSFVCTCASYTGRLSMSDFSFLMIGFPGG